jgi:hypothetical protein
LQVKAIFPEGEVQIDQFENVAEPHRAGAVGLEQQRQVQKQIPCGNDKQGS